MTKTFFAADYGVLTEGGDGRVEPLVDGGCGLGGIGAEETVGCGVAAFMAADGAGCGVGVSVAAAASATTDAEGCGVPCCCCNPEGKGEPCASCGAGVGCKVTDAACAVACALDSVCCTHPKSRAAIARATIIVIGFFMAIPTLRSLELKLFERANARGHWRALFFEGQFVCFFIRRTGAQEEWERIVGRGIARSGAKAGFGAPVLVVRQLKKPGLARGTRFRRGLGPVAPGTLQAGRIFPKASARLREVFSF